MEELRVALEWILDEFKHINYHDLTGNEIRIMRAACKALHLQVVMNEYEEITGYKPVEE